MSAATRMGGVFIALGSNLGDRAANIRAGLRALQRGGAVSVLRVSTLHETAPLGGPALQSNYLNAAAELHTDLSPHELLNEMLKIERELGRTRVEGERNGPRTLDLDLLIHGDLVRNEPGLVVPHPRMWEREFVLRPLAEICDLTALRQTCPRPLPAREGSVAARRSGC